MVRWIRGAVTIAALAAVLPGSAWAQMVSTADAVVLNIDIPSASTTVRPPFAVGGWAIDRTSTVDSGIDAVQLWAYPAGGGAPMFIGTAVLEGHRPDVAGYYGAQYGASGFNLLVTAGIPPGDYQIAVFARRRSTQEFAPARLVGVTVRGVTLSDLSCTSGQVPSWDGTSWQCVAAGTGPAEESLSCPHDHAPLPARSRALARSSSTLARSSSTLARVRAKAVHGSAAR